MALKWYEGFEIAQTAGYSARKYAAFLGSITAPAGRLFGTSATMSNYATTPSLGSQNTWIIGFGAFIASTSGAPRFTVMRGATEQCHLEVAASGSGYVWVLKRGATTIGTSAVVHAFSAWCYVELKVTARTGTNGAYELRVDEEVELGPTASVNLAGSGSDGADVFQFGTTSNTHRWDDIYICDDQGANNNDFLGDSAIRGILPNGDGATTQWTPSTGSTHYTLVDDLASAVNDADYNSTGTNGQLDLYAYENVSGLINGTIRGIMVTTDMRMQTSGTSTVKVVIRQGGVNYDQATHTVNGTTVVGHTQVIELSPDDSAAWEVADIDAMQVGVQRVS